MSQPRVAVLGSCSVDFITYAPRLPTPGETVHGTKFTTSYGGKGANQCVAAAKLGANVCMIGKLGDDDWGRKYKEYLCNLGVDTSQLTLSTRSDTGVAQVCVGAGGENQIVIVAGANADVDAVVVDAAESAVRAADVLVAQLETPLPATLHAFRLNQGIRILNAAPARTDLAELLPYCSVLCVNELEASLMTGLSITSAQSGAPAVRRLLQEGCDTVIITLGKDGALVASKTDNTVIHVHGETVIPVDTTGAGDAFIGALAVFLPSNKTRPLHQVVGAACSVATRSVTLVGTQDSYPTSHQVFHKEYPFTTIP